MMVLRSSTDDVAGDSDNGTIGGTGDSMVGVPGNRTLGVTAHATVGGTGGNADEVTSPMAAVVMTVMELMT